MKFNLKVRLASLALSLGIILLSTFACNTVKADKLVKLPYVEVIKNSLVAIVKEIGK